MHNTRKLIVAMNALEKISPLVKELSQVTFRIEELEEEDGFLLERGYVHDSESVFDVKSLVLLEAHQKEKAIKEYDYVMEIDVPIIQGLHPDDPFFHVYHVKKETFHILVGDKPRNYTDVHVVDQDNVQIHAYHIKENKIFLSNFPGHYLTGNGVVVAPDLDTACQLLKESLETEGLGDKFSRVDVYELDTKTRKAHILFNGDY